MNSTIADEIQELQFPDPNAVIVCAGSALELYGIRYAADIDLIVNSVNFEYLKDLGWKEEVRGKFDESMEQVTALSDTSGRFDVWSQWYDASLPKGQRNRSFEQMLKESISHQAGFYIVTLKYLRHLKQVEGRAKVAVVIRLIDKYLEQA